MCVGTQVCFFKLKQFCIFFLTIQISCGIIIISAPVAELADAPDLGSGVFDVGVQVPSGAPNSKNPNLVPVGNGFGFLIHFELF